MMPSDADATLQRIYRAEHGRLLRYFEKRVDRNEAPDLAQEVFIRLLRAGYLKQIDNPGAYLTRCARNLLIDRARRTRSEQSIAYPLDDSRDAPLPPEQTWRIEEADARRLYRKTILAMPRRTRRIFLMRRLTGKTNGQIAEEIGVSYQCVANHMMRAMARCRNAVLYLHNTP